MKLFFFYFLFLRFACAEPTTVSEFERSLMGNGLWCPRKKKDRDGKVRRSGDVKDIDGDRKERREQGHRHIGMEWGFVFLVNFSGQGTLIFSLLFFLPTVTVDNVFECVKKQKVIRIVFWWGRGGRGVRRGRGKQNRMIADGGRRRERKEGGSELYPHGIFLFSLSDLTYRKVVEKKAEG